MIRIADMKHALTLAVEKLGRYEASRKGLMFEGNVTFTGQTAYAVWDEKGTRLYATINFPGMNSEGTLSRAEADRMTGYAVHELGHVFHTDLDVFKAQAKKSPFRKHLLNGMEDPRIEDCVMKSGQAPGARHALTILIDSLLATLPPTFDAGDIRQAPFIIAVLGRQARWGMNVPAGTFRIPRSLAPFYRIAMDGVKDAPAGKAGTRYLATVVDRLMQWLKENEAALQQDAQQQQQGDGSGEQPDGEGGAGGAGGDPVEQQVDDQAKAKGGAGRADKLDDDEITPVEPDSSMDRLAEKIGKGKPTGRLDYYGEPRIYDPVSGVPESFHNRVAQAGARVGQLSTTLGRLLVSPERAGWTPQRPSGRFDSRRSTRAMAGSESVFKQRWERPGLTTDVVLLVDQSGSMSGRNAQAAADCACVLAAALDRLSGVRFAAFGFSSGTHLPPAAGGDGMRGQQAEASGGYRVNLAKIKGFDESLSNEVKSRLGRGVATGGTPDMPAIKGGADMLRRRAANRRVMMVLTDGDGEGGASGTRAAVDYAVRCGVEVIGIGIDTSVVDCYPVSLKVSSTHDLIGRAMNLLIATLSAKYQIVD